jgi:hypothetical protein
MSERIGSAPDTSDPSKFSGAKFIAQNFPDLALSKPVEYAQRGRSESDVSGTDKASDRIAYWLNALEKIYERHSDDSQAMNRIKSIYHREFAIKPEDISEKSLRFGDGPVDEGERQRKIDGIIDGQCYSLDAWVDYLTGARSKYPMWAKYWAFSAVVQMGKFEKDIKTLKSGEERINGSFVPRQSDTIAPFPLLNVWALDKTIGVMRGRVERQADLANMTTIERDAYLKTNILQNPSTTLTDQEFARLATANDFSRLYAQFLNEIPEYSPDALRDTRGEWAVAKQGSDPHDILDKLSGYPHGWCIDNVAEASNYLEDGDLEIFYSLDPYGQPKVPRVAIYSINGKIDQVRGISARENIDPYISEVVIAKMADFSNGQEFVRKAQDTAHVDEIVAAVRRGQELGRDDLRFLYEVDRNIEYLGLVPDRRPRRIRADRDARADMSLALDIEQGLIGLRPEDFFELSSRMPYYYGNLMLSDSQMIASGQPLLPEVIQGDLTVYGFSQIFGCEFPNMVTKNCNLPDVEGIQVNYRLILPEKVGDTLYMPKLSSVDNVVLPSEVGGDLYLESVESADGLILPRTIGGTVWLSVMQDSDIDILRQRYPELTIKRKTDLVQ